jgi:ATP-dependent helicase IRC3
MDRTSVVEATEKLTKGEAANIITRLKHGAQVCPPYSLNPSSFLTSIAQAYYEKKMREDRKESQLAEKERLRIARSTVRVGPLDQ